LTEIRRFFSAAGALRGFDAALDELGNAQAADLQFQPVGIHFRKLEQIVGEPRETPRVLEDNLEEADTICGSSMAPAEKRFRKTLNGGERRFELVGNVGNEIPADALELAQLGDVMQHDDRAGGFRGADRCDGDRKKVLAQSAGDDFGFDAGLTFQDLANRLDQLRAAPLPPARSRIAAARRGPEFRQASI